MHIKKLEICGFKSFVDRTVIHFDHDIIGVVGPNGCGKSNVVDAIRWVMGEQSAKALRGKGMGDVIFSGSESRPQGGFAEVTITFDNGDPEMARDLPLEYREYSELSVTRRIYRGDGSNEYFINKTPVRLRDVTDVFLGTGVGRKAYSIVEQGKIGLIVSARPEDRRLLIEEAAGITKYKARKKQAETKMALTRQNLTRVTDIVSEIERQLGNLKRQAAKAARYVRYREELDDLLLWDASHRWLELAAVSGVADAEVRQGEESVSRERANVDARDAEIEVMRQEAMSAEAAAERAQSDAFFSDNEVREQHALIERASDRYAHLGERMVQARHEQGELEHKAAALAAEAEELGRELEAAEARQSDEQSRVQAEAQLLDDLRRQSEGDEAALGRHRQELSAAVAAIARGEAAVAGYEQRRGESERRRERLELELARLEGEHGGLGMKRRELDDRVKELVNRKQAMCDARDALGAELPELRRELAAEEKQREKERALLRDKQSRLRALRELHERMEGVGAGVRNLLKTGDASLHGLFADRIEVPSEYTAALAGLIGERLQCVVIDDLDRALELLRGLAKDRRGRATIIPRTIASGPEAVKTPPSLSQVAALTDAAHDDGVIGLVSEQIGYDAQDEAVVRALCGDAVLVKTAADARRLQAGQVGSELVTLDGTVFHADGRVTGGAGDALAAGMLESKREIRELEETVAELSAKVAERDAAVTALAERVGKLQQALDQAKSEAHEAEISMVTGQQDFQRLEQKFTLVGRRRGEVAAEVSELAVASDETERVHQQTLATLAQAHASEEAARVAVAETEQRAQDSRERFAAQQLVFTERKVQLASVSERASACRETRERALREHRDVSQRIDALEADRHTSAEEAGRVAAEIFAAKVALAEARVRAREAQAAFENARLGLDDARHTLGLREAELREMRAVLQELQTRLGEQQVRLSKLQLEREHLEQAIRERFRGLELVKVVGDYHARDMITREHKRRMQELTDTIDRMGAVNLDAMKEYEEQAERFDYYTNHKNDLEAALADLDKAIAQMNKESKRLFQHAFEGINRRFKEIFPKMFRGGKAELRLTNPDDMLETGIDILAQPPGKRLGNIELMSGGEKAFTAVSLLLSIFRFKPSPFCILDEVDAPLDDANIDRYVEGIRAMTDRSQFIVITHSKRTMQAVDVLYGVTMQEPGVSKLVGVRVGDAATRSAKRRLTTVAPAAPAAEILEAPTAVA